MDLDELLGQLSVTPESLSCYSDSEKNELLSLLEDKLCSRATQSFQSFVRYIDVPGAPLSDLEECEEFYPDKIEPAKHHRLICETLQLVADGKLKRVMIFAPPGSAKSTYTTVCFPPFMLGRTPRTNIISVSYASPLSRRFGRRCRSIVKSQAYRRLFGAVLSEESKAADEWALSNGSEYMAGGILSGITGNRADGLLIDDPVAGRQEADSEATQTSTWEAYKSDLVTRLKPNAWQVLIMTRWNESDLAGQLLPENYKGESGYVMCRDGHEWFIICLPMEAEHEDDPLGRKPGELLWSEWFVREDVLKIKHAPHMVREWSSLYQQRPSGDGGVYFKRHWFKFYDVRPRGLRYYGASDYAVTQKGGDFTVHGVAGLDTRGDLYLVDYWRDQQLTDVSVEEFIRLVRNYEPLGWAEDADQIVKSIGPFINRRMLQTRAYCSREQFVMGRMDKQQRARSFQALAAMGKVYLPRNEPWVADFLDRIIKFPAGRYDDDVDMLGLLGRLLDRMIDGREIAEEEQPQVLPVDDGYRRGETVDNSEDSWRTA